MGLGIGNVLFWEIVWFFWEICGIFCELLGKYGSYRYEDNFGLQVGKI
jgi:hypothetical protein